MAGLPGRHKLKAKPQPQGQRVLDLQQTASRLSQEQGPPLGA